MEKESFGADPSESEYPIPLWHYEVDSIKCEEGGEVVHLQFRRYCRMVIH